MPNTALSMLLYLVSVQMRLLLVNAIECNIMVIGTLSHEIVPGL